MTSEDALLDSSPDQLTGPLTRAEISLEQSPGKALQHRSWERTVEEYSRRNLSFEKDKGPALAGLTTHYQALLQDEPFLGIWRADIVQGLLWTSSQCATRTSLKNSPTWSWLSINGEVDYDDLWVKHGYHDENNHVVPLLQVVDASVRWKATPLTSAVEGFTLCVHGAMIAARTRAAETTTQMELLHTDRDTDITLFSLDVPLDQPPTEVCLLRVARIESRDRERPDSAHGNQVALVLVAADQRAEDSYRRIGLCVVDARREADEADEPDGPFHTAPHVTISLV